MTATEADDPEDAGVTAAELALGLLEGEERAAALRRTLADPAFARAVEGWRGHFAALFATWPEAEPGDTMEARVRAAIDSPPGVSPWWRRMAVAASLVAAVLLVAIVARPVRVVTLTSPPRIVRVPAPLVAALRIEGGTPLAALYDRRTGEVRIAGGVQVPAGRDAELWAIGADGVPRALGLLRRDGASRVRVPAPFEGAGVTLAISIEPVGGAPGAAPTGPVIATGALTEI